MTGIPEPRPAFLARLEVEGRTALVLGDSACPLDILFNALFAAAELEEKGRRLGVFRTFVEVDGRDGALVYELDAAHLHTATDHGDRRLPSFFDVREYDPCGEDVFGYGGESQDDLGKHPESPLGADEEPGQVVPGRGLYRQAAGAHHVPVGEHDLKPQDLIAHRPVADRVGAARVGRGHTA